LPQAVRYVGFDLSPQYIARAQARYGQRAEFFVGTAAGLLAAPDQRLLEADLVLCNGLLHHLEDAEVVEILTLAARVLKTDGRMVCLEPTTLAHQVPWSRWMMAQDRGKNIRSEQEWKSLVASVFPRPETHILTGLYRIPYTHIVIVCRNAPPLPVHSGSPTAHS
jgi:ubiquinone/menaquinone biosynthesis C-methylase UbiE